MPTQKELINNGETEKIPIRIIHNDKTKEFLTTSGFLKPTNQKKSSLKQIALSLLSGMIVAGILSFGIYVFADSNPWPYAPGATLNPGCSPIDDVNCTVISPIDGTGYSFSKGLVGYWKFDEGTGTTTADSSSYGNTGTINGTPDWVTGQFGDALTFDGSSNYVSIPANSHMEVEGNEFTISAWINLANISSDQTIIANGGSSYGFGLVILSGGSGVSLYKIGVTGQTVTYTHTFSTGTWYHIVAVQHFSSPGNPSFVEVFVNGVSIGTNNDANAYTSSSGQTISIGYGPSGFFNGSLDDVRVYNRALSNQEIKILAGAGTGGGGGGGSDSFWSAGDSGTNSLFETGAGNDAFGNYSLATGYQSVAGNMEYTHYGVSTVTSSGPGITCDNSNCTFTTQLVVGDTVVFGTVGDSNGNGQTATITSISSNNIMYVSPTPTAFTNSGFTYTSKNFSTAMGYQASALASYSAAIGGDVIAGGPYSVSIGNGSFARGENSITLGSNDVAFGEGSITIGSNDVAVGASAMTFGSNDIAFGASSMVLGHDDFASGQLSTAMGYQTFATGQYSLSTGYQTRAAGFGSTAMGISTIASGLGSTALGSGDVASGDYSTALGYNTTASGDYSTTIGEYNSVNGTPRSINPLGTDYAFAIGNGNGSSNIYGYSNVSSDGSGIITCDNNSCNFTTALNVGETIVFGAVGDSNGNGQTATIKSITNDNAFTVFPESSSFSGSSFTYINRSNALAVDWEGHILVNNGAGGGISNGYTLPNTDGTAGQVLTTDGEGNVTWGAGSGGTTVANSLWTESDGILYPTDSSYPVSISSDTPNNIWSEVSGTNGLGDWYSVTMSSNGKYQTAVANNSGSIWISADHGSSWTEKSETNGYNWYSVAMSSDGQYQAAVANGGSVWTSFDYGSSWSVVSSTSGYNWNSVVMSSDGLYRTAVDAGDTGIWISADHGSSWTEKSGTNGHNWKSVAMSSDGQYQTVVDTSSGSIWTSTDHGSSWTEKSGTNGHNWKSVAMSSDGQYQTAVDTSSGSIWTSTDHGSSWTEKSETNGHGWYSVAMSSDGQYQTAVDTSSGSIWTSTDHGSSWTEKNDTSGYYWLSIIMSSNGKYQTAGANNGGSGSSIWTSTDYGSSWTEVQNENGQSWQSIAMSSGGQYQLAADYISGGSIWTTGYQGGGVAIGSGITSNGGVLATGLFSIANGLNSTAMGSNDIAIGGNSFAEGSNDIAFGNNSFAMGSNDFSAGIASLALGNDTSTGYTPMAFNIPAGGETIDFGGYIQYRFRKGDEVEIQPMNGKYGAPITRTLTNVSGNGITLDSPIDDTTIGGIITDITIGQYATAIGSSTFSNGEASFAGGIKSIASGIASFALGSNDNASGDYSTALGFNTQASGDYQTVVGKYNTPNGTPGDWKDTDYAFIVGNGGPVNPEGFTAGGTGLISDSGTNEGGGENITCPDANCKFTLELKVGYTIFVNNTSAVVTAIDSDTTMTVNHYTGASGSIFTYRAISDAFAVDWQGNVIAQGTGTFPEGVVTQYVTSDTNPTLSTNGQIAVADVGGGSSRICIKTDLGTECSEFGSFGIPAKETVDPVSGDQMGSGDYVIGMVDKKESDNALHGVWVKLSSVLDQIKANGGSLPNNLNPISGVDTTTMLGRVANVLNSLGITIKDSLTSIANLATDNFSANTAKIKKLEMVDSATGGTYCTWIENGEWQKTQGDCSSSTVAAVTTQNPASQTTQNNGSNLSQTVNQATQQVQNQIQDQIQSQVQQQVQQALLNKRDLETAIALAGSKTETDYTADSWTTMQTSLVAATTQDTNSSATQSDIDTATLNLNNTITGLVLINPPATSSDQSTPVFDISAQPLEPIGNLIRDTFDYLLNKIWMAIEWATQRTTAPAVKPAADLLQGAQNFANTAAANAKGNNKIIYSMLKKSSAGLLNPIENTLKFLINK